VKLFLGFARQAFTASAMYRFEFWMQLVGNLISMYGVYWLWNTLYLQSPGYFSTSLEQMLTYAMLAMILDVILRPANLPRYYINDAMRTGAIQMDLLRPLDFTFHLLARSSGQLIFSVLTQGLLAFLLGAFFLGLRPPASLVHVLLFLPSLILAFLVGFGLNFLIGMISIYTIQAERIAWVYYAVLRFLSGQMVPLWYFPAFLAQIAVLLPFHSMVGIPLSIYIGRLSMAEAVNALAVQALWAGALLGLGRLVWRQAYTRLTVQGG
jgi:ABC-2 type transport system permease protein